MFKKGFPKGRRGGKEEQKKEMRPTTFSCTCRSMRELHTSCSLSGLPCIPTARHFTVLCVLYTLHLYLFLGVTLKN